MSEVKIDAGDTVRHGPSGETWIVAVVEGEHLYWCGWPPGRAQLADCELVKKATPEERRGLLERLAAIGRDEHGHLDVRACIAVERLKAEPAKA